MPVFESSGEVDTGGSTVTSVAISNVTLTGSNRSLYLAQTARFASVNAGTPTRTGDTFAEVAEYYNTAGAGDLYNSLWFSTNEPGTTAQTLTFNSSSSATWGGQYINCTGVNQTTRYENLTRNTDELATSDMTAMDVSSNTGDLVLDYVAAINSATIGSPSGTGHTQRSASTFPSTSWAMKMGSTPGAATVSIGWAITGSTDCATHYAWNVPADTIAPVTTVPASGQCINTYTETEVPGISVAEGSSALTAVATTCTAGCTLTYDTTGTSVTISGNGTNAATLLNGASEAEYNTVLDTLTMRGSTPDTTITVTVIPTDGTLNDSDQFTVLCDPAGITITGTNANVIAAVESLQVRLLSGQTNDTISVNVVDDTGGTPLEADSSFVVGLLSYFLLSTGFMTYLRRRRR